MRSSALNQKLEEEEKGGETNKKGGLFYDVQADPTNPGHNKTYLNMVKENPQINPDGEIADVRRCQVI